jgi:hypothetical protein
MKNPTSTPPIVFLYAILITMAFYTSISYFAYKKDLLLFDAEQLRNEFETSNFKVVLIGTSLSAHAFYFDLEFEEFAKTKGVDNLSFHRFTWSGRQLEHHDPLLIELANLKPDLVLLENKLIYYDGIKNQFEAWFLKISNFLSTLLHRTSKQTYAGYEVLLQKSFLQSEIDNIDQSVTPASAAKAARIQRGFNPTIALNLFLHHAQKNLIPVLLFDVPLSSEVEALYPATDRTYENLIDQEYQSYYGVGRLKSDISLDSNYYKQDLVHANQKGRERFSEWLAKTIQRLRK